MVIEGMSEAFRALPVKRWGSSFMAIGARFWYLEKQTVVIEMNNPEHALTLLTIRKTVAALREALARLDHVLAEQEPDEPVDTAKPRPVLRLVVDNESPTLTERRAALRRYSDGFDDCERDIIAMMEAEHEDLD